MPAPVIVWFRRDLRLADNEALTAASATGRPILPLFIHDETVEALGAAPRFRLGLSVESLAARLAARGLRLVLRRGRALEVLKDLVAETGATSVQWTRYYEPAHIARDCAVKDWARSAGVAARSFAGTLLHEPSHLLTTAGRPYSVFTPFWRRLAASDIPAALPEPATLVPCAAWPATEPLDSWAMARPMSRGAAVVRPWLAVGEGAARDRLEAFVREDPATYARDRDQAALAATSGLSENLAWGEISARQIWHRRAACDPAADRFLTELGWRDFAWHLMAHFPTLATRNWRADWDQFPWQADGAEAEAWRRGDTGVAFVDAGMRELYATGRMHNRVRMVAASYLTKHLLTDWRVGLDWFADCLVDWDPAANAMNWQWVAGSGPDAAPFFRIFNPDTQAEKFDADGLYRRRWLGPDTPEAHAFLAARPRAWGPRADPARPPSLASGRERALSAFKSLPRGA